MPNNTSAVLSGGIPDTSKIEFRYMPKNSTLMIIRPSPSVPATVGGGSMYYWMGDTFVGGSMLYNFALKIDTVSLGAWGFSQVGVDLVSYEIKNNAIDYSTLRHINDTQKRLCDTSGSAKWHYGGAIFENTVEAGALNPDGCLYIYGYLDVSGGRHLIVSRIQADDAEDFSKIRYLMSDNTWADTLGNPSNLKRLASNIAPEISVSEIKTGADAGKFALVYTQNTNGNTIILALSSALSGEFSDTKTVFVTDTPAAIGPMSIFAYNAKAHPAISNDRELFISYNVNGGDIVANANIYRPRIIRYAQVPPAP